MKVNYDNKKPTKYEINEAELAVSLPSKEMFIKDKDNNVISLLKPSTEWIDLVLQNGWVAYLSSYGTPKYCIRDGVVHIQGLIKNGTGTLGETIADLPKEIGPEFRLIQTTQSSGEIARVDITEDGGILFNTGSTAWLSLCISYAV